VARLPLLALKKRDPLERLLTNERQIATFVVHKPEHAAAGAP